MCSILCSYSIFSSSCTWSYSVSVLTISLYSRYLSPYFTGKETEASRDFHMASKWWSWYQHRPVWLKDWGTPLLSLFLSLSFSFKITALWRYNSIRLNRAHIWSTGHTHTPPWFPRQEYCSRPCCSPAQRTQKPSGYSHWSPLSLDQKQWR